MANKLYGYADVGRFGLGHGLLAWGRCVVWCHAEGVPVIAPQWLRLRIGPYLRRERDKRFYYRLFRTGRQIGGLERLRLLTFARRLCAANARPAPGARPDRETIVVFTNSPADNERKFFHEIAGHSAVVRTALLDMTKPRFVPPPPTGPHVALHIRGGDFTVPIDISLLKSGRHNLRLPQHWYRDMLDGLRRRLGQELPAIVYSDCSNEELADVLALPRTARSRHKESITDMLAMSEASVLISSGSGFCRWGSYFGQVPRLCFPGQRTVRALGPVADVDLEPECDAAADIPELFCDQIRARLDWWRPITSGVARPR